MTDYYKDENKLSEKTVIHNDYELTIITYSTGKNTFNYTRGIVKRISNGIEVCDIKRNYGNFRYFFYTKDGEDWMQCGTKYYSYTFVNLTTGVVYENENCSPNDFCWADVKISPDKNTLAVIGCYWACPYMTLFYDISDIPNKGCKELDMKEFLMDTEEADEGDVCQWNEDGTYTHIETKEWIKSLNRYIGDEDYGNYDTYWKNDDLEDKEFKRIILERKDGAMVVKDSV